MTDVPPGHRAVFAGHRAVFAMAATIVLLLRVPFATAGHVQPLQYANQLVDVAPWASADGTVAVAMLGDSTMRSQILEMCGKLGYEYRVDGEAELRPPGVYSRQHDPFSTIYHFSCESPKGRVPRVVFAFDSPGGVGFLNIWARRVERLQASAHVDHFDVVYFGSSGLHTTHLLPLRGWPQPARAASLETDVEAAALGIAAAGACPIFHTTHWVCEENYQGKYREVVASAAADPGFFEAQCRGAGHQDLALCASSTLTSAGSESIAARERKAIAGTGAAVIDVHTYTKNQCWATPPGDGRHYPPLLHLQNAALLREVGRCLAAQQRSTTNSTTTSY